MCDLYVSVGLATKKPTSVEAARSAFDNHVKPLLGNRKAEGIARADIEKLLIDVSKRYAHLSSDPVKQAANRISSEIAELLGAQPAASDDDAFNLTDASPEDLSPVRTILGRVAKARWLDMREVAVRVNLTVATLQTCRWMGVDPPFQKIGGRVVYSADEVDAWKATQTKAKTEKVPGSRGSAC